MLLDNRQYICDYINFSMGFLAGIGIGIFIFTKSLIMPILMILISFLLFYFTKENFKPTPDLVMHIHSDTPTEDILSEIENLSRNK